MLLKVVFVFLLGTICLHHIEATSRQDQMKSERLTTFDCDNTGLQEWHRNITTLFTTQNDNEKMRMLGRESEVGGYQMEITYNSHFENINCPRHLLQSECKAVHMFTLDDFFAHYNTDVHHQRYNKYDTFSALLYDAVKKLSAMSPLDSNQILYRGMSSPFHVVSRPFCFGQFLSTSLLKHVAMEFKGPRGTLIEFQSPLPRHAGFIGAMSYYPYEEEVLISPFEKFVESKPNHHDAIHLRSSAN